MLLREQLYVVTLAKEKTISDAARKLYITQPALSSFISKLEKNIGHPLFDRRNGEFIPTFLGEKYIEAAEEMIKIQEKYNLEQSLISQNCFGRLRIGVQTRRSPQIIHKIILMFRKNYPNIKVSFEESNNSTLYNMLFNNEIDMMICSLSQRRENLFYEKIYDEKILLSICKNDKVADYAKDISEKYKEISLHDLKDSLIILPHKGQSLREDMDRVFKDNNFIPNEIMEIRSIETITKLVSINLGVGVTRESYTKNISSENVSYYSIKGKNNYQTELVVACHKSSAESLDFLKMIKDIKETIIENDH